MCVNDLQFGFKKNMGCSHAIFVLQQCTEYFLQQGSNVYMAALDTTKAFDRVNHIKLFHLNMPFNLLHTDITFHHFFTVSLGAQNLPFQKIVSSTLVCFCLSD